MKRISFILGLGLAALLMVTGCSTATQKPVPSPAPATYSPVSPPQPERVAAGSRAPSALNRPFKVLFKNAQGFLVPSNPPPAITLAWGPSTDPTVVAYNIYFGGSTRSYTNETNFGNVTNATITTGFQLGGKYFFAATAVDSIGLESVFSNEVSFQFPSTPPPPGGLEMQGFLAIDSSPAMDEEWVPVMEWPIALTMPEGYFRLRIVTATGTSQ